jgi:type IV pilus assembly protein PilB
MGVAPYNIAASVSLITAQRLVRRLCTVCREPQMLSAETLHQVGMSQQALPESAYRVYTPRGCSACHQGFKGRTGIFQVMPVNAAMQSLILQEAGLAELTRQATRDGVCSLREAGLRKVMAGETSLDEVLAATREQT